MGIALFGDSVVGENLSDWGKLRRRRVAGKPFLGSTAEAGVGGGREIVGERTESPRNENDALSALAGCEVGEAADLSNGDLKLPPALAGLKMGVKASRKSL